MERKELDFTLKQNRYLQGGTKEACVKAKEFLTHATNPGNQIHSVLSCVNANEFMGAVKTLIALADQEEDQIPKTYEYKKDKRKISMKTLNINSKVRIKLTPCGIAKLRAKHEHISSMFPSIGKFTLPKTDVDGYCEMILWQVMNTFGEDMYEGNSNLPFKANIQIDETLFEETEE